jgi:hypothetical protein
VYYQTPAGLFMVSSSSDGTYTCGLCSTQPWSTFQDSKGQIIVHVQFCHCMPGYVLLVCQLLAEVRVVEQHVVGDRFKLELLLGALLVLVCTALHLL